MKGRGNGDDKLAKAKEEAERKVNQINTFRRSSISNNPPPPREEKPAKAKKQSNKRVTTPTKKVPPPKKTRSSTPSRMSSSRRMEESSSSRSEEEDEENGLLQEEVDEDNEEEIEERIISKVKSKRGRKTTSTYQTPQSPPPPPQHQRRSSMNSSMNSSVNSSINSSITPPPSLIIGIAQITSTSDISQNMKTCFDAIKTAAEQNIQFLFFPEGFYYMGPATKSSKLKDLKPFGLKLDSPFINQICEYAKANSMWISLGGFPEIIDNNNICNTHIVINLQGYIVSVYRQVHTLPSNCYTPGNNMVVLGIDDIKFALSIGNDIYYPNFYRQLRIKGYADFLIIPSSLSDDLGEDQWMTLLKTRAIENQCIVVAANQVGKNYKGFKSYGHSVIIAPDGKMLNAPNTVQGVVVVRVDLSSIERERENNRIQFERNDVYNGIISPSC